MSKIRILELSLRNFKGIKDFKIAPAGKDMNIYGDNATGKTSLMDAFLWLLFDKDSSNSSNFNVKTLDRLGNVIHGLEHEVIAVLDIDGHQVELQKIYKEKWTKKKGQAETTFTGHNTDYFINGVPKKLEEYKAYLAQIVPEDTFKILTNPLYFNRSLDWKSRRKIALDMCGELADEDVFKQDKSLTELSDLLVDKSIDDLKAEMSARRKKLNEELKSIPYRIDELSRENLEIDIEGLTTKRDELQGKLSDVKNSKGIDYDFRIRNINGSISVLENQIKEMKQNLTSEIRENIDTAMESLSSIKTSYYKSKDKAEELNRKIRSNEREVQTIEKDMDGLREEFRRASVEVFDEDSICCPTCKQNLPIDEVNSLREKFETNKQNYLSEINSEGKSNKSKLEEIIFSLEMWQAELKEVDEESTLFEGMMKDKMGEINNLEQQLRSIDISSLPEYKECQSKINHLNLQKQELSKMAEQQDNAVEIKELESQISEVNKELAKVDLIKESEKRIEDLKDRERTLANMVAETEKIEFLCGQYVITKSNLLEDKLNSKFEIVRFKLFNVQVNGGIDDTFITTVDGVPFEDLNNAMKINAGLDIIATLSEHYNLIAPIFLDNRESVNRIPDMEAQVVNLIVSNDKNLRVEVE